MASLMNHIAVLVDELKRRRVLHVAAVYLVGAWAVIQVADITFTRLGMPEWTVTFVIVIGALLFPVVVGLAWAFDLTRSGVVRATPAPAGAASPEPGPGESAPASAAPASSRRSTHRHRRLTLGLAGLMTLPLLAFGIWWTGMRGARGADLDAELIAVTPFRLAGASEELSYLREGLMDLLAARIGGSGTELSVVPPRTVSRRIKDRLGSLEADPDRDEALGLAQELGAGLLLEGEVVGTEESFTVAARLYDVRTGYRLTTAELKTTPDSLHHLVDRLATRLVAAESGLRQDRLATLTTASMPALRAFLEGEQAFRRGDHSGAVRAYDRAVRLDTTFALAALGLIRSRGWAVGVSSETDFAQAEAIVERGLGRLSEGDRLFYEALVGPDTPEPMRARLDRRLRAAEQMPDMPELQYLAADGLLHFGEVLGVEGAIEQARQRFERTVAIDSTYLEPLLHLLQLATSRDDTAGVRRYGDLLLAIDSAGPWAAAVRYGRATGEAGPTTAAPVSLDTIGFEALNAVTAARWSEPPPDEVIAEWARRFEANSAPPDELQRMLRGLGVYAVNAGLPSLLERVRERARAGGMRDGDALDLTFALYWLRDLDAARAAADEVRRQARAERAGAPPDAPVPPDATERECLLGHLALAEGEHGRARELADGIRAAMREGRNPWINSADAGCVRFLDAALAVYTDQPDALRRLELFDDSLRAGAPMPSFYLPVYNLAAVRLWEEMGQPRRALEAARRHLNLPGAAFWHVELFGEAARLADQLGRREEAIPLYRTYLQWRAEPEGVFIERADRARRALARLAGET